MKVLIIIKNGGMSKNDILGYFYVPFVIRWFEFNADDVEIKNN